MIGHFNFWRAHEFANYHMLDRVAEIQCECNVKYYIICYSSILKIKAKNIRDLKLVTFESLPSRENMLSNTNSNVRNGKIEIIRNFDCLNAPFIFNNYSPLNCIKLAIRSIAWTMDIFRV